MQAGAELFYANAQIQAEIKLLGRVRHLDVQSERHQSNNGHAIRRSIQEIEMEYIRQRTNDDAVVSRPMEVARPRRLTQVRNTAQLEGSTKEEERRTPIGCLPLPKRLERFWNSITGSQDDIDLEEYQRCAKASFYVTRIWQLFSMPRIRRATSASLVMMISQQLCGIVSAVQRATGPILTVTKRTSCNSTVPLSSTIRVKPLILYLAQD